jgi:hypothetical protein
MSLNLRELNTVKYQLRSLIFVSVSICLFNSSFELLDISTTSNSTGSSGGNETDLSTGRSVSTNSRGNTDVLLVTTTERMVNWVHGNSSDLGPSLSESLHLVVNSTSLQDRLINSFTGGDETNHGSSNTGEGLSGTGGKLDSGLAQIIGMTDDDSRGTGASSELTLITRLVFNVTDLSTFGNLVDGKDVTSGEGSLGTGVDELTSVHSFNGEEMVVLESVLIGVSEDNLGEGSTTAGIVDDLSDDTLNVTILFSEIENSESGGSDSVMLVSLEDGILLTSSTTSDDFTHVNV